MDVDVLMGQVEIAHCCHGDDGERLIDFIQVHVARRPARSL